MGTRGLLGFKVANVTGNDYRPAYRFFYNQWASPDGLGTNVLKFVQIFNRFGHEHYPQVKNWKGLQDRIAGMTVVNIDDPIPQANQCAYEDTANFRVNGGSKTWYTYTHRLQNGHLLEALATGNIGHFPNKSGFELDSLFCEWAYILNFPQMKLEVWRGFQKQPWAGNPFGQKIIQGYYPIRRVVSFSLENPPPIPKFYSIIKQMMTKLHLS